MDNSLLTKRKKKVMLESSIYHDKQRCTKIKQSNGRKKKRKKTHTHTQTNVINK